MRLNYLVKLNRRVFCENFNAGIVKLTEIVLIDFYFTY